MPLWPWAVLLLPKRIHTIKALQILLNGPQSHHRQHQAIHTRLYAVTEISLSFNPEEEVVVSLARQCSSTVHVLLQIMSEETLCSKGTPWWILVFRSMVNARKIRRYQRKIEAQGKRIFLALLPLIKYAYIPELHLHQAAHFARTTDVLVGKEMRYQT